MTAPMFRALWLLLLAFAALSAAKKDQPELSETPFSSPLSNLFYFDDSDVVIAFETEPRIVYRSDDAGANWVKVKEITEGYSVHIRPHLYDKKVAIAIGVDTDHWITKDRGATWSKIETENPVLPNTESSVVFHASDPDKIIFVTQFCPDGDCTGRAVYTTNGGESMHILRDKVVQCTWTKATDVFTTGAEDMDNNHIICIAEGRFSHYVKDNRLVVSSDFFKNEFEPPLDDGRLVQGHVSLATVKGFIALATKSEGSLELVLYVTDDATIWHRAVFDGHRLEEGAYTILESTNYSIQLDVMTSNVDSPMGTLFTSNSNGTYFTKNIEHTNRNKWGIVDFEKIQNIQGLALVNVVQNWKEVQKSNFVEREVVSRFSFDDGRTWQPLRVDDDHLHLHSVTSQRNAGRVFSSPAPGLVMGVGSVGKLLREWKQCDTFVSSDAGETWKSALSGPHLYEFGDQGAILVAIEDAPTKKVRYSIDHGKEWQTFQLEEEVRPVTLQTAPDSTSLKFLLIAVKGSGSNYKHVAISLDFAGLHERQCKSSDFEKWPARVDEKGEPTCLMGHKQFYRRRKADSDCFVDYDFKDPEAEFEVCPCSDLDYECDYNFVKDEDTGKCEPAGPLLAPSDACKSGKETFLGSSGYRLIPGNVCSKSATGAISKDEPVERPCKQSEKTPATGKVSHTTTNFMVPGIREYFYLEQTTGGAGETIIMQTSSRTVHITHDHGKTWEEILEGEEIVAIYPHQYFREAVYLLTASDKVYYSHNQGVKFNSFTAPEGPNLDRVQILSFHPNDKDWLLWMGGKNCDTSGFSKDCHTVAHVTTNGGNEWKTLLSYTKKCLFVGSEDRKDSEKLIYCEQYRDEDPTTGKVKLVASDDFFEHKNTHFDDIVSFATMSEFIVVAIHDDVEKTLRVDTSVDGQTFARAQFPPKFEVKVQQAYTVLDSSTHSIFLHVTVNNERDQEYGSIIKSNSNGTSYVLSASYVNRDDKAYVDFEKMQGLTGVAVINVVANPEELARGTPKKLQTQITHNDGAEWGLIKPPAKDSEGNSFKCSGSLQNCALHLHGYTERRNPRNTLSSPSAVGLMLGVGNVGPSLGTYKTGDTFITRDGGVSWTEVFKGTYTWEYGDQGALIVLVKRDTPVQDVFYTRDEGLTWSKYEFSDHPVIIDEITSVPADTSRNFLLWARDADDLVTINLDFTGLTDRLCLMDASDPTRADSDYYLWTPKHPLSNDDCLFGQVAEYFRKKPESDCYNGGSTVTLHNVSRICECTRQDFECDYNYQRQSDGSCALVEGLKPADHSAICKDDPDAIEWYEPTGYRRVPLTRCQGGKELEYTTKKHPCPGKEEEYAKKNGISGFGLFLAIFIPIVVAIAAGYWVWTNWDGKFGRIRLGDGGPGMSAGVNSESAFVRYPVLAISGVVAILSAIPMLMGSVWRAAMGRFGRGGYGFNRPYTSRGSFQRTRGDYAVVEDEGELLGEESDEEM